MIKRLALAAGLWAAGTLLVLAAPAQAVVINIDPGTVGETFTDRSFDLAQLDGLALDGNAVTLDFVFAPKQLRAEATGSYQATLYFDIPGTVSFAVLPSLGGTLLDETGNNIASSTSRSASQPFFGPPFTITYGLTFSLASPLSFQSLQFSILLPAFSGGQVTNARLEFNGSSTDAALTVVTPAQQLPEPASLALFGLGLLGLGVVVRRRHCLARPYFQSSSTPS